VTDTGQTRLYAAGLTVLEMFGDRDSFKEHVQERIQKELLSFGLQVFNGNVAEMRDSEGNAYFSSLKQKAISGATNDARVCVRNYLEVGIVTEDQSHGCWRYSLVACPFQNRKQTL
jgi:flotillin